MRPSCSAAATMHEVGGGEWSCGGGHGVVLVSACIAGA